MEAKLKMSLLQKVEELVSEMTLAEKHKCCNG